MPVLDDVHDSGICHLWEVVSTQGCFSESFPVGDDVTS